MGDELTGIPREMRYQPKLVESIYLCVYKTGDETHGVSSRFMAQSILTRVDCIFSSLSPERENALTKARKGRIVRPGFRGVMYRKSRESPRRRSKQRGKRLTPRKYCCWKFRNENERRRRKRREDESEKGTRSVRNWNGQIRTGQVRNDQFDNEFCRDDSNELKVPLGVVFNKNIR